MTESLLGKIIGLASMFDDDKPEKKLAQTYRPVLEASEVIDLFSRLTMHQQAALMRLMSRNLVIKIEDEAHMGYEFDYEVDGAMISVAMSDAD